MKEPLYPVVIIEQTPERKIGMALLYFFALIGMIDVVVRDPDYYVGRIMVLSFAVFGFIDLIMEGALWFK